MAIAKAIWDLGRGTSEREVYEATVLTHGKIEAMYVGRGERGRASHRNFSQPEGRVEESKFPKKDENPYLNEAYANYLVENGKKEIKLLIVGRVGYGKSALINTLFGKNLVEERDSAQSVTKKVSCHTLSIHGIKVIIADTPGFFGVSESSHDIVSGIKENMKDVDLILFCIKMSERFTESENELIRIIRNEYNETVLLKHTIFALTFANKVEVPGNDSSVTRPEHFDNKLQEMRAAIASAVEHQGRFTNQEASQIPVVPVGYKERKLPTTKDWFVPFWHYCFKRTKDITKAALLTIGAEQIASSTSDDASVSLNRNDLDILENLARNDKHPGEGSFLLKIIEILKKFLGLK